MALMEGAKEAHHTGMNVIVRLYNPVTNTLEVQRTPTVSKSVVLTDSGVIWAKPSTKRIRFMGINYHVPQNATTSGGGNVTVKLLDGSTDIGVWFYDYFPALAVSTTPGHYRTVITPYGNGFLLSGDLKCSFSAAVTAGVCLCVWGCEE